MVYLRLWALLEGHFGGKNGRFKEEPTKVEVGLELFRISALE
jgi:hypothetical protein